ncbi:ABC-three component system protein [Cupriavidus necator]
MGEPKPISRSAGHIVAAFTFQFERALHRMFHAKRRGTRIGIETLDDVVELQIRVDGTVEIMLEQDKNVVEGGAQPFQDRSAKLWHTIHVWLTILAAQGRDFDHISLCLATNAVVPSTSLAARMAAARDADDCLACIAEIRALVETTTGKARASLAAICSYPDPAIAEVIANIRLLDGSGATTPSGSWVVETIDRFNLHSTLEDQGAEIYQTLLGKLVDECKARWMRKEPAWLDPMHYVDRLQDEIARRNLERFTDRPMLHVDFRAYLESGGRDHLFLKQLAALQLTPERIDRELEKFWAFYVERVRLEKTGTIPPQDWLRRNDELHQRWEMCRSNAQLEEDDRADSTPQSLARRVFRKTIDETHKAKLGLHDTHTLYFTHGNYHALANDAEGEHYVHWHDMYAPAKATEQ